MTLTGGMAGLFSYTWENLFFTFYGKRFAFDSKKLNMNLEVSFYIVATENAEYVLQILTGKVKKISPVGSSSLLLSFFLL